MDRYLDMLRSDADELDLLAKDLLINVTSFFRDPKVFDLLAEDDRSGPGPQPIRRSAAPHLDRRVQHRRGDLFPRHAVPRADRRREAQHQAAGLRLRRRSGRGRHRPGGPVSRRRSRQMFRRRGSPASSPRKITATGSRPNCARSVVFTVQDVLADPPFSRLDMVSCRNLLIYLRPEAQAKVVSLFHFALREGGILLLGSSETIGNVDGRFEVDLQAGAAVSPHRPQPAGRIRLLRGVGDGVRVPARRDQGRAASRQAALAELCRRLVMETYAPAAVLINRKHECLYSLGPTDRYLRVAPGHPTHDLLAMARQDCAPSSGRRSSRPARRMPASSSPAAGRTAMARRFVQHRRPAGSERRRGAVAGLLRGRAGARSSEQAPAAAPQDVPRVAELEQELEATRTELQGAIRNLEISSEEQKAINEEALSVNEEYPVHQRGAADLEGRTAVAQ